MAVIRNPFNAALVRTYHNALLLEETKRKYSRTSTSFRGRNAMEFIYEAAAEGKGSRTQGEIAAYLKISKPSCTTLLEKLESTGYVERRRSLTDERRSDIFLTRKGRLVTVYQAANRNQVIDATLRDFTPEEQEIIYRGFRKLNEVLEECISSLETSADHKEQVKGVTE